MKALILFLISFKAFALVPTPQEARDAVTKALTTEGWTIDAKFEKFSRALIVLDHPTAKKQIALSRSVILFRDFATGEEARSTGVLHAQFFESIYNTYSPSIPELATPVSNWVE